MHLAIKKIFHTCCFAFAILCISSVYINAQESNLKSITPELIGNELCASCRFSHLINKNMHETLTSGMSTSLSFYFQLTGLDGNSIRTRTKSVNFRYDVWEKKYILSYDGQVKQFSGYVHFQSFLADSLTFKLFPARKLPPQKKLLLVLHFLPEKISANQKKKLAFWINNENESQEGAPAKEPSSGFSINISRLISGFLGSEANVKTQKFSTRPFTINALRNDENAAR